MGILVVSMANPFLCLNEDANGCTPDTEYTKLSGVSGEQADLCRTFLSLAGHFQIDRQLKAQLLWDILSGDEKALRQTF